MRYKPRSLTSHVGDYDPKQVAAVSVPVMIKIIAQMKRPRRGHDAQGRLKKVNLDGSYEGFENYMAPMRAKRIAALSAANDEAAQAIYTDKVLQPKSSTFLTPEWDEMVPFPNSEFAR